jgi:hypothetical protein
MPRIRWVNEDEATGELKALYDQAQANSPAKVVPDILKTMSLRPDLLRPIIEASRVHFSDGALSRAQHELIASYVAAANRCHY